jgi:Integrase
LRFDALTIPRPGMVNEMEWSEVDWDAERWTIPAAKMKTGWDHVVPLSRQALAILRSVQKLTGHRRYAFSCSKDAPLSNNTLNKRLRLLGIDTKTDHCAHGFRTTFSTLSHHEEIKDAKAWDGDVVELQLAHLDNSTVKGSNKKHGPLALIGSRTKLMQHWLIGSTTGSIPRRSCRSREARRPEHRSPGVVNVPSSIRGKLM